VDIKWNFNDSLSRIVGECVDSEQLAGFLDWLIHIDGSGRLVEDRVSFFNDCSDRLSDSSVFGLCILVDLAVSAMFEGKVTQRLTMAIPLPGRTSWN